MGISPHGYNKTEEVTINTLNNKRVLITGACGFIGPNFIGELIAQGATVTALDLSTADWAKLPQKGVKCIEADILDASSLRGTTKDIDIIYHLAARTDIDGKTIEDYRVNYEGTKNLIDEASKNKNLERFVFYSTQLVVGLFNETRFIDETEPYRTKTAYGESKIEGEKVVKKYCERAKIDYTIIRPTSVYGPWGEAPFRQFFQTIKRHRYFHVGKAGNLVSWVYVKNLIDLTILASLSKQAENQTYFGNDLHPYTMREIVGLVGAYYKFNVPTIPNIVITTVAYALGVLKLLGLNVPIYPFRLRNIKANYCYDMQKSIGIGYRPKYDLKQGIRETLDWYESKKLI